MKNKRWLKAMLLPFAVILVSCTGLSNTISLGGSFPVAQNNTAKTWYFAVSGDSRNCGDIVMPAIAQQVNNSQSQFYWHLGDFRAIYDFDEDMKQRPQTPPLSILGYELRAWNDFIDNQVSRFTIPVF